MKKTNKNGESSVRGKNNIREKSVYDIAVIGAGASGMMAAAAAAGKGASVVLIDGNDRVGKKIYATGNGRCNFSNIYASSADYNHPEDGFVESVLSRFTPDDAIAFFRELGLLHRVEKEGRCYPYSGQAAAVVSVLEYELERLGVDIITGNAAERCGRDAAGSGPDKGGAYGKCDAEGDGVFEIELADGSRICGRKLVIACGGRAGLKFGSTGDGYGFAKGFGHTLEAPRPALVGCISDDEDISLLKGRVRAVATLYKNGDIALAEDGSAVSEAGEVQFSGSGISGICVMDITRYMETMRPLKIKKKKKNAETGETEKTYAGEASEGPDHSISIDLVPEMDRRELCGMINYNIARSLSYSRMRAEQIEENAGELLGKALSGIVNDRIAGVLGNKCAREMISDGIMDGVSADELTLILAERGAGILKDLRVHITATHGWNEAQVTAGGVKRGEIDPEDLQSVLMPGLYFCGEVIDVDGRCGGYNLQWAWASGAVCGRAAAESLK